MRTNDYDEILYFVGGFTWDPCPSPPDPAPERHPEPGCTDSNNCPCDLCRYAGMAHVLREQQQGWERRRLIKQALNTENREMAERAAKRQNLKSESINQRPLELD